MKILIVDDDSKFTSILEQDIYAYFTKHHDKATVTVINKNFNELEIVDKYHIVFLDIDLITENGLNIAKKIREIDNNVIIVFISSKSNLVFQTFVVKPFFFIRKSNYETDMNYFFEILDNYLKKNTYIYLDYRSTEVRIPLDSIIYIESHGHQLWVHSKNDVYYDSSSLSGFLSKHSYINFVQIHRSYIVNLDYLKGINKGEVLLIDNIKLPIGRKYKQIFFERYQEYLIN